MELAIYIYTFQKTIFGIGIYVEFWCVSVSSPLVFNVRGFIGRSPNDTRSLSKRGLESRAVDYHRLPTLSTNHSTHWLTRWWFQRFSNFTPTWGIDPI